MAITVDGQTVLLPPIRALEDMGKGALAYLDLIVSARPGGRHAAVGVAAASRLLEHWRWQQEFDRSHLAPEQVLAQLLGDEGKLLTWVKDLLPRLEAKQRAKEAQEAAK